MALDSEALLKGLRWTYNSGKTKTLEWRVSQLQAILKITTKHEKDILQALHLDLNKPEYEAFLHEVCQVWSSFFFG